MREILIQFLENHNTESDGIYITQDLNQYVDKLLKNAVIITIIEENELKGIIAYYVNNVIEKEAFLSMLLINRGYQNKGCGSMLIETMIKNIKRHSFQTIKLEVLKSNTRAIEFYKNYGFGIIKENNMTFIMKLDIELK